MKKVIKLLALSFILFLGFLVIWINDGRGVIIESQESKTISGTAVFNKIKWFKYKDKEIWMMNQSHHGHNAPKDKWERLAIVIDKTKSPKTARFYQLESGPLEWSDELKERPFRVTCFMCHPNGPRAIRPNYNSLTRSISIKDRLKILSWNTRIKLYGRIVPHKSHKIEDKTLKVKFRWRGKLENEKLNIKSCTKCHNENSFLSRGVLTRQNLMTIKFMVESEQMPPFGFSFSGSDRIELENFLNGF